MKFDGYLLVADMDNTLLDSGVKISDKNRRAVKYFTENGGFFTVATGRAAFAAKAKLDGLAVNAPAILQNGALLYDFDKNETIFEKYIEDNRKEAVKIMHEKYPFLGFEIYSGNDVYVYSECHLTGRLKKRKQTVRGMTEDAWSLPWTKLLMISDKETLDKYIPVYRSYDSGYSVRSGDEFFDIVSSGASKGRALKTLCELMGTDISRTAAVGDNLNDIELLKTAGTGFAVANAAPEAAEAADFAAPSCDDDAIAWIINRFGKHGWNG